MSGDSEELKARLVRIKEENRRMKEQRVAEREDTRKDFTDIPPIKSRCINPEHGPMTPSERTRRYRAKFRRLYLSVHAADYFAFRDAARDLGVAKSVMLAKLLAVAIDQHRQGKLRELLRTVKGRSVLTPAKDDGDVAIIKEDAEGGAHR